MHPYHDNQMFISALVALLIVGLICLGLLIALIVVVLGRRHERCKKSDSSSIGTDAKKDVQEVNQTQNIIDKLNEIDKETKLGTTIGIIGIALVLDIYSVDMFLRNIIITSIIGFILAFIYILLSFPAFRHFIIKIRNKFK